MIETERLNIKPLTLNQVLKFLELNNELELELGLKENHRTISEQLRNGIVNYTIPWIQANFEDYLFSTVWVVIDKKENSIVADLSFKGAPNAKGEIEIGYGTQPNYRNKGYMTEAVGAMVKWASGQENVKCVLAETRSDNIPSIILLKKNHFLYLKQAGDMLWWRIDFKK